MTTTRTGVTLLQKVRRHIRQHDMLLGGERVLLAVSGGLDSIALLDVMTRLAPTLRLSLAVAHFDHGLRDEESKLDAEFVVEAARTRGLRAYVGRGDVGKVASLGKLSIEEAGRRVRYQFLQRVARRHDFNVVLTGHTANDNAETLLINLLRGTGLSGLAGIPPVRPLGERTLLGRPLLDVDRTEIEEYAREVELQWREDESNNSPRFLRNRVRQELLPLMTEFNPSVVATLNQTASIMRGLEQYLSHAVELATERVVTERTEEKVDLNVGRLKHFLPAIQSEIVQRIVSKQFDIPPISHGAVERILGLTWKESGSKAEIGGGISALRDREAISVRCEPPPFVPFERTFRPGDDVPAERFILSTQVMDRDRVRFTRNSSIEFADLDKLGETLTLRSWREGDRFQPLGMQGEKKLSDFLIDQKVSLDRKRDVLVVADGDRVVWVCGMRLDERFRVTPGSKRAVRFELRKGGRRESGS